MNHSKTFDHGAAVAVVDRPKREMSVLQAVRWAFATEHASIDFDDDGSGASRVGVSPIWVMMQRGQLGCQIDGGGRSKSHDDADIIAAVLEAMPRELGGKAMAVQIASLARAGMVPDWMAGAVPRCVPVNWAYENQHGRFGKTAVFDVVTTVYRGRKVERQIIGTPVTYRPSHAQISAARQRYLDWWGALLWLRQEIAGAGLSSVLVGRSMPPMTPWKVDNVATLKTGVDKRSPH